MNNCGLRYSQLIWQMSSACAQIWLYGLAYSFRLQCQRSRMCTVFEAKVPIFKSLDPKSRHSFRHWSFVIHCINSPSCSSQFFSKKNCNSMRIIYFSSTAGIRKFSSVCSCLYELDDTVFWVTHCSYLHNDFGITLMQSYSNVGYVQLF